MLKKFYGFQMGIFSGGFTNEGALRVLQNMGPYFKNNFLGDLNMYF